MGPGLERGSREAPQPMELSAMPSLDRLRLSPPSAGCRSHSKAPCLTGNTMALWLLVPTGEHGNLPPASACCLDPLIRGPSHCSMYPRGWSRRGSSGQWPMGARTLAHPWCSEWIINDEAGYRARHAAAAVPGRSQLSILADDSAGFCTESAILESP